MSKSMSYLIVGLLLSIKLDHLVVDSVWTAILAVILGLVSFFFCLFSVLTNK